jgi:hypothetical protein
MWEIERHDWARLRSAGASAGVPEGLRALAEATSREAAEAAYWKVDNVVVLQGSLFEAAVAATSALLMVLQTCSNVARPLVLELLVQIGSGEPDPSELAAGMGDLQTRCIQELQRGMALFAYLLEHGTEDEQASCVDLLGLCAQDDFDLRPQVLYLLKRGSSDAGSGAVRKLAETWLSQL